MIVKRMSDDELHHNPTRERLWAEAKRARISEDRFQKAVRMLLAGEEGAQKAALDALAAYEAER